MRIVTSSNNFSRGQIDHNLQGRFDLPVYQTGCEKFKNFYSNFQGNAMYRTGFELAVENIGSDCRLQEFKFNYEQGYVLVFLDSKIKFLTYNSSNELVWVTDGGGVVLEVATPYTITQIKQLQFAQNGDVMYIAHPDHQPRKLTRVSANSFTLATFTRTNDPFTGAGLYPKCVCFHQSRLFYASSDNFPTKIWGSVSGSYDDFTSTPVTEDDKAVIRNVTEVSERIEWIFSGSNSLLLGTAEGIVSCTSEGTSFSPSDFEANKVIDEGSDNTVPVRKDGLVFYINNFKRKLFSFSYDLLTERYVANNLNIVSKDITSGQIEKIRLIRSELDLFYILKKDGTFLTLNFNESEGIVGWHTHNMGNNANVKDLCVITDNNGEEKLFFMVYVNGKYTLQTLCPYIDYPLRSDFYTSNEANDNNAYSRYIAELLKSNVYLDSATCYSDLLDYEFTYDKDLSTLTCNSLSSPVLFSSSDVGKSLSYRTEDGYKWAIFKITSFISALSVGVEFINGFSDEDYVYTNGFYRSFSSLSGLSFYNGTEVSVNINGGYLGEFTISSGTLNLDREAFSLVLGYKYEGEIKSMNLGFSVDGVNTQITPKNIYKVVMRFVYSAGGSFGSNKYNIADIQLYSLFGLYDNPPLPIDGDMELIYNDDTSSNKVAYILQKQPLPLNVTGLFIEARYENKI